MIGGKDESQLTVRVNGFYSILCTNYFLSSLMSAAAFPQDYDTNVTE